MGILNTLKNTQKNYDPAKDKINDSDSLPSGDYPVRLKIALVKTDKQGNDQVGLTLEVVSGDNANRLEFLNLAFNEELPEFVIEKNSKIVLKLASLLGLKLGKKADTEEGIVDVFSEAVGQQFLMKLKISPNKKNPDYPYRNYEFEKLSDSKPDLDDEIDDDDLPF